MRLLDLHPWDLTPSEAIRLQSQLAPLVDRTGGPRVVSLVAAADVAFVDRPYRRLAGLARAAVVLMSYPELALLEHHVVERPVTFPYVPGLLSFRETPALAAAFERLTHEPDLLLVDGHGYSHPRRFGIACHIGILCGVPTIGCAKSRLCGEAIVPDRERGATVELIDRSEVIGLVVRTREDVAPVYASVGHRITLGRAGAWLLRLAQGYRLPEPLRLADRLSKGRSLSI